MDMLMISIVKGWESVKVHHCPMLRNVNDLKTHSSLIQLLFFFYYYCSEFRAVFFYAQLTEIEPSALQGNILEQKIHDQPPILLSFPGLHL